MTHLYQALLGPEWDALAPVTRKLHSPDPTVMFEGEVDIVRGRNPVARVLASLLGFPPDGRSQPALVRVGLSDGGELLERWYDGRHFATWQGRRAGFLIERFGPFRLSLGLRIDGDTLRFDQAGVSIWGCPLPALAAPRIVASEREAAGRHAFDVALSLPLVGLVIRYRGQLEEATD